MIIFHVHEGRIRIGLAVIIPSLETGCVPVVNRLTFQKTPEQLQISLVIAFPFSPAVYKNYLTINTDLFQKAADLLKVRCPRFFCYSKGLDVFPVHKLHRLLDLAEHLFFPFPHRFFPDKGVFIGTRFQFRSINEVLWSSIFVTLMAKKYHKSVTLHSLPQTEFYNH